MPNTCTPYTANMIYGASGGWLCRKIVHEQHFLAYIYFYIVWFRECIAPRQQRTSGACRREPGFGHPTCAQHGKKAHQETSGRETDLRSPMPVTLNRVPVPLEPPSPCSNKNTNTTNTPNLVGAAPPVLATVVEDRVEPVVPAGVTLVFRHYEVLLAPEVHTAERNIAGKRGNAAQQAHSTREREDKEKDINFGSRGGLAQLPGCDQNIQTQYRKRQSLLRCAQL